MKRTAEQTLEWLLKNQPRNAVAINALMVKLGRKQTPQVHRGAETPPIKAKVWPQAGGRPITLREWVRRRVESDPLTIQDRAVMEARGWKYFEKKKRSRL